MEEYLVEEYEYNNHTIKILSDLEPSSPREWDNVGTMIVKHSRYNLGDRGFEDTEERAMYKGFDVFERYMRLAKGAKMVLPLSIYDHSGLSMWIGTPYTDSYRSWDSSFVGAIVAFDEDINKIGADETRLEEILKDEVDYYDRYLRGDTYGYSIEQDGEAIDSCFGYFGLADVKGDAEAVVDNLERQQT